MSRVRVIGPARQDSKAEVGSPLEGELPQVREDAGAVEAAVLQSAKAVVVDSPAAPGSTAVKDADRCVPINVPVAREFALQTARKVLDRAADAGGIVAGAFYQDQWARDSSFATLGYLALGQTEPVRRNLEAFLSNVRKGQVPLRIGANNVDMALRFLPLPAMLKTALAKRPRKPVFHEDKEGHVPFDPNALVVMAAHAYATATNDQDFIKRHLGVLREAIAWYDGFRGADGLIAKEQRFGGWTDNMPKHGRVLYTNVCFARALECLADLCDRADQPSAAAEYRREHARVVDQINQQFWNGRHYRDWLADEGGEHFTTDGNLLAIVWGIADASRSAEILRFVDEQGVDATVPCRSTDRTVPGLRYTPFINMAGLQDYHNGAAWTWLGCVDAVARVKAGQPERGREILDRVAGLVARDQDFLEVYDPDAKPYLRPGYKTDGSFAWSAGLYAWAEHELRRA